MLGRKESSAAWTPTVPAAKLTSTTMTLAPGDPTPSAGLQRHNLQVKHLCTKNKTSVFFLKANSVKVIFKKLPGYVNNRNAKLEKRCYVLILKTYKGSFINKDISNAYHNHRKCKAAIYNE